MKHNLRNHKGYPIWNAMLSRCYNPKNKSYKYYGARGIGVCDEWKDTTIFINWFDINYVDGYQLDRINNDMGYSPSNCRFASKIINCRNTRKLMSTNTSGYRGVGFDKRRNKWVARIIVNNKHIHIGYHDTAKLAALHYDKYVLDNELEHTKNFSEKA